MLESLKRHLSNEVECTSALEAAAAQISADDDDIKDAFLNDTDPETVALGAEDDPEIAKLVDAIPPTDDTDKITEKDIEKAIETYIPEGEIEMDYTFEGNNEFDSIDESELVDVGDEPNNGERTENVIEEFIDDDFSDLGSSGSDDDYDPEYDDDDFDDDFECGTFESAKNDDDDDDDDDDGKKNDDDDEAVKEADLIEPEDIVDFID